MSRDYRLYKQDVIHEFPDGTFLHNDDVIEGDSPTQSDEVVLVELDGSETKAVLLGYHPLFRRAKAAS